MVHTIWGWWTWAYLSWPPDYELFCHCRNGCRSQECPGFARQTAVLMDTRIKPFMLLDRLQLFAQNDSLSWSGWSHCPPSLCRIWNSPPSACSSPSSSVCWGRGLCLVGSAAGISLDDKWQRCSVLNRIVSLWLGWERSLQPRTLSWSLRSTVSHPLVSKLVLQSLITSKPTAAAEVAAEGIHVYVSKLQSRSWWTVSGWSSIYMVTGCVWGRWVKLEHMLQGFVLLGGRTRGQLLCGCSYLLTECMLREHGHNLPPQ